MKCTRAATRLHAGFMSQPVTVQLVSTQILGELSMHGHWRTCASAVAACRCKGRLTHRQVNMPAGTCAATRLGWHHTGSRRQADVVQVASVELLTKLSRLSSTTVLQACASAGACCASSS